MWYVLSVLFLQNAVYFIILTYLVPVLFTFYIQDLLKLKKKIGTKRLKRSIYGFRCILLVAYIVEKFHNCARKDGFFKSRHNCRIMMDKDKSKRTTGAQ